ncbi:MAG: hypothetical protein BGO34_10260 [Bacteroidia bacterium 44-10]|nr:MAG: hypothetical protein BGO34_10260 [Bacteroidia bacterium 44-10]
MRNNQSGFLANLVIRESHVLPLLLSLLVIYFAQGFLYEGGSSLSQSALFLILGISGFYFVLTVFLREKKDMFFNAWTALLLLNIIGFFLSGDISNSSHFGMLKGVMVSLLTFYPFYYFTRKNMLQEKHLVYFLIVMLPIAIIQFVLKREQILLDRSGNNENVVSNVAYVFANLIPFVFFIRKRVLSFVISFILVFFTIQGAKRGAIITAGIGLIIYIYYQLQAVKEKNYVLNYVLTFIAVSILIYYTYKVFQSNEYLITRLEKMAEGNVSNRDAIYTNIMSGWFNSDNILNLIFGFGFAGSLKLSGTGNFAHNDWLELLSNFGLIGVFIYLWVFYAAYRLIRNPYWTKEKKIIMITVVIMWFLTTLFSMGYTSMNGYLRAMILAYLIGSENNNFGKDSDNI